VVDLSDKEAFEISIEENVHRKTLDPIEEARAYQCYVKKYGYGSTTELAIQIGKSEEYVSHRIALLSLPISIQEIVRRRLLTSSAAWELSRVRNDEILLELGNVAANQSLTSRQLRAAANLVNEGASTNEVLDQIGVGRSPPRVDVFKAERREKKVRKAATTIMRAAMIRLDNMVNELEEGSKLHEELLRLRVSTHEVIDDFVSNQDEQSFVDSIRSFIRRQYIGCINAKDVDSYFAIRLNQTYSMFDDFLPLSLMSYEEARVHIEKVFKAIDSSRSTIENLRIRRLKDMGLATFVFRYNMVIKGLPYYARARVSVVLVRVNREWKVLHDHWSQAAYKSKSFDSLKRFAKEYSALNISAGPGRERRD
jgi:ParB-like chromosome segregation protein Spo0J/ketosteroid isomerase-like protein